MVRMKLMQLLVLQLLVAQLRWLLQTSLLLVMPMLLLPGVKLLLPLQEVRLWAGHRVLLLLRMDLLQML